MKKNFNKKIVDYNGTPVMENGVNIIIKDIICKYLFLGAGIKDDDNGDKKYEAYKLMRKISEAKGDVDISDKESILIKQVCSLSLNAGAYGQIVELLNK